MAANNSATDVYKQWRNEVQTSTSAALRKTFQMYIKEDSPFDHLLGITNIFRYFAH